MNNCGNCANYDRKKMKHTDVCGSCLIAYVNDERQEPSHWKPLRKTNADRIRAMSDEELAEFLCEVNGCNQVKCPGAELCIWGDGKANGIKKWLKQPAEEGTE